MGLNRMRDQILPGVTVFVVPKRRKLNDEVRKGCCY